MNHRYLLCDESFVSFKSDCLKEILHRLNIDYDDKTHHLNFFDYYRIQTSKNFRDQLIKLMNTTYIYHQILDSNSRKHLYFVKKNAIKKIKLDKVNHPMWKLIAIEGNCQRYLIFVNQKDRPLVVIYDLLSQRFSKDTFSMDGSPKSQIQTNWNNRTQRLIIFATQKDQRLSSMLILSPHPENVFKLVKLTRIESEYRVHRCEYCVYCTIKQDYVCWLNQ